ncbi:MAG: hypothetical protein A3E01_20590 [Gammaproteobacteria bacterium RIFCSPHIGHO2_12_FULL_63_22]|nr:MAG: hypothetical protein A3E01_20590 [Gammaproteobacteria bacterium RIFCSPHIGHO2_12_FULL_63_22]
MNGILRRHAGRVFLLAALAGASLVASAADRRFVPVPATEYQKLQVINGATIISAAGRGFHAGATLAPTSSRRAWLSVSVKNTGTVPVPFNDAGIQVQHGDNTLGMKSAEEVMGQGKDDGLVRDKCANASESSQINCNIESFNNKQEARTKELSAAKAVLAPGALVARQFQLELPKRSKAIPLSLKVRVTVEGETIEFDFNELN